MIFAYASTYNELHCTEGLIPLLCLCSIPNPKASRTMLPDYREDYFVELELRGSIRFRRVIGVAVK